MTVCGSGLDFYSRFTGHVLERVDAVNLRQSIKTITLFFYDTDDSYMAVEYIVPLHFDLDDISNHDYIFNLDNARHVDQCKSFCVSNYLTSHISLSHINFACASQGYVFEDVSKGLALDSNY